MPVWYAKQHGQFVPEINARICKMIYNDVLAGKFLSVDDKEVDTGVLHRMKDERFCSEKSSWLLVDRTNKERFPMSQFTPKQGQYLSFIHAYTEGFGMPPSESEIAAAMKVRPPSVNGMLKTLVKNGLIQKVPGEARSIEILIDPGQIPRWKKKIHCKMKLWAPVDASEEWLNQRFDEVIQHRIAELAKKKNKVASRNSDSPEIVYRFKITLRNTKPPIWRRIETHDATIEQFHELIQTAMGWTNSHLHEFDVDGTHYTHPGFLQDQFDDFGAVSYAEHRITDLSARYGEKLQMRYMYDFGDGWEHDIKLEEVFPAEPKAKYPRCVAGKLACPPEDVGGVWGFYEFVEAVSDPKHDRHEELVEWYGPFDPNEFSLDETTERMQQGLPNYL